MEREIIIQEAIDLCNECRRAGVEIRIFGGVAAAIISEDWFNRNLRFRRHHKDVDVVGRKEDLKSVRRIMAIRGYEEVKQIALQTEGERAVFGRKDCVIDFAGDDLSFCQRLPVRDRLALDFPTLSITDLALEKLQIVEPGPVQIIDFIALIISPKAESLDRIRLWSILGRSWGYWYSAKCFLKAAEVFASANGITEAIAHLHSFESWIDDTPRGICWRARSLFRTLIPWRAPVEPIDGEQSH